MPDGVGGGLLGFIAIRDRMPRFHEDSRNPRVSPDIAMQHKMNTTRTNAYENERKRTSRGCPYPPTIFNRLVSRASVLILKNQCPKHALMRDAELVGGGMFRLVRNGVQ
jgi:hypothetical protein